MIKTSNIQNSDELALRDEVFQVIDQDGIQEATSQLKEKGIDVSHIKIHITNPGDDLFDQYEVQTKLLFDKADSDWGKYIERLRSNGLDENNLTVQDLRNVANAEGVLLEGKMPGFVITAGDDEIVFFGIKEENVLEMAQKYARKAGLTTTINNTAEAKEYLRSLAKESLFHEAGHAAYSRLSESSKQIWQTFVSNHPDIRGRVIELQRDKYAEETEIPIEDEAFADVVVKYVSNGQLGRLDVDKDCVDLLKDLVKTL